MDISWMLWIYMDISWKIKLWIYPLTFLHYDVFYITGELITCTYTADQFYLYFIEVRLMNGNAFYVD